MTELDNFQLGQYKLIEAIGHGGMATVYKAYQESLDRYVAVKVLLSNRDPQFAARFKREARAIAALQHHNILPIYDYGEQNGLLYFVMQYVDTGITLHDMLGRPIAMTETLRLIGHVLNALEYAHTRGVVHRDIKPANILMPSPSWALLADFGIAKLLNDSQHLTMTGFIIGTAAYMAPEQASGKPIDARTDLYSLGVVLYEILTGRVPFDAETPMAMLTKHVYETPPQPRLLNPDLSPLIEAVLLRALQKDPNQRYQTATEMATELTRVAAHLDRARPLSRISSLYQAGVEAFEQERWDDAAERFKRLVAIDPNYEDATILLRASQAAQARATRQGAAVAPISTPPPNDNQPILDASAPATIVGPTLKASPIPDKLGNSAGRASAEVIPAGSAPMDRKARCPQCGQDVRVEWQACPFCRAPLNQAIVSKSEIRPDIAQPVANAQAATSKPVWQRWAIIAGVVLLIGGGASGAWAWSRRTANSAIVPPLAVTTVSAAPTSTSTPAVSPTATSTPTPPSSATPQPTATPPQPTDTRQPTDTPRPPDALVTSTQQRLRGGPGQNYAILGAFTQGTTLTITGKDATGAWIQVAAPDGQTGWMLAANMQINLALSDIAVVAAPPSPTSAPTPKPKPKLSPTLAAQPVQPTPLPEPTSPPPPPTSTSEPTLTPTAKPHSPPKPPREPPPP